MAVSSREVVLLQMGGPSTLDELRPFYQRLFGDPDLIQLPDALRPVQRQLAWVAARARARALRERYRRIGGGSPLLRHTTELADVLKREFARRGQPVRVHIAMRYTEPFATHVVADLARSQAPDVTLLPLYPHWSQSTTGSSIADFLHAADAVEYRGRMTIVQAWGDAPGYLELLRERIESARAALAEEWHGPIHLLFSAHGLPVRYVQKGDPYPLHVQRTAQAVAQQLDGFAGWHLGYQSRMGPVRWLEPSTDRVLRQLARHGAAAVLAVPLGFVSDHIETLYDLDILYCDEAHELGIPYYRRVPSFNSDEAFASVLADVVDGCNALLTPPSGAFTTS